MTDKPTPPEARTIGGKNEKLRPPTSDFIIAFLITLLILAAFVVGGQNRVIKSYENMATEQQIIIKELLNKNYDR